ncbi:MAG: CPBP family intramembrane glutamic endopeptidase [Alphaproteobacteria bacterium]
MPLFWLLAFGLAWVITVPAALSAHGIAGIGVPLGATRLSGFAPAIAAFVAAAFTGQLGALWRRLSRLFVSPLFYLLAVGLPLLFLAAPFVWARLEGGETPHLGLSRDLLMSAALWFVLALGEEIGWRGFALPNLAARRGFWAGAAILGLAWTLWHYPLLLANARVSSLDDAVYWLGLFSLQIFLANFLISWLMLRSGAVLIPTLFHTAFNLVATAYYAVAIDLRITGAMAAVVVLLFLVDRSPKLAE